MLAFDLAGRPCSFCGESGAAVGPNRLQYGYGALICTTCVDGYHKSAATPPDAAAAADLWADKSGEELLANLQLVVSTKRQVDDFLQAYIDLLRERRLSWASIGGALGVSRQAAWERYSRPRD